MTTTQQEPAGLPASLHSDRRPEPPGFRFEEADAGRPYQPSVLAGPLHSIIAVRQVTPSLRSVGDLDRAQAEHNGQRAGQPARLTVRAGR